MILFKMKLHPFVLLTAGIAGVAFTAAGEVVKIELPPEPMLLKQAPGADLASGQCLICHSSEYMTTQPPLGRTYWKSAVEKMQNKFGAPVAADQVEPLVDYLVKAYGAEKPGGAKTPAAVAPQSTGDTPKNSTTPRSPSK